MKLVIAGSRTIHCDQTVLDGLNQILDHHGWPSDIISGGAAGVDQSAKRIAEYNNVNYIECKPIYKHTKDRGAPLRRNDDMAIMGDVLLAVWDGKSPGTGHMIRTMKQRNKPVYIIYPNSAA